MDQIISLVSGLALSAVMQGAKKIQAIPVNEGQVGRIRMVLVVLSAVVSLGTAYLNGSLADEGTLKPIVDAVIIFAASQASYILAKKPAVIE